jgi:hypothetical protein
MVRLTEVVWEEISSLRLTSAPRETNFIVGLWQTSVTVSLNYYYMLELK